MNNKGKRWTRQIERAELINFILMRYEPFYMIKLQSECMKHKLSYEQAEATGEMFSIIFNLDCKPTDLLHTDDDMSNTVLNYYERLQAYLGYIKSSKLPFTKEDMMSFMEYEYNNNPTLNMRHMDWGNFAFICLAAAKRFYSVGYAKSNCVEVQLWNGCKLKRVDTRLFRKAFIRLEKDFWDIVEKRRLRSILKQEKDEKED